MAEPASEPPSASLVRIAGTVAAFWERERVAVSLAAGRPTGPVFRFTEGPPTANGPPHLGHVVARAVKDAVLRYRRMRGFHLVSPSAGWDCHGLPVEVEMEKRLGLHSKKEIEAYGVDRFSAACRASVLESVAEWRAMSARLGYWLDYDHPYATMDAPYIESVWWSLKQLFERGLLERGHYVLPYCPRCETPLSSHEVAQGYREMTDPAITVRFRLKGGDATPPLYLLLWTTTPWTLPANLLVAAREEFTYVEIGAPDGSRSILEESAAHRYAPDAPILRRFPGRELAGREYEPPFPFAGEGPGRFRVVLDPFVEATEGTGLVHIAPSFGSDDERIGRRESVGVFDPLDSRGHFTAAVPPVEGKRFKEADPILIADLEARGLLVHRSHLRHTYPFCWRCDNPLIYRALDSWFVRTSRRTTDLVENNATVRWVPEHLRTGRFGNFLTEAKDWALSRNRYWGTPLPIWRCPSGHSACVGSFDELATLTAAPLPAEFDPHRVTVDTISFPCPTCRAPTRREPYTIDAWYDSGSAPYAQYHYPFAPGPFDPAAPLDAVAEGLDQTRGWFYALLVLSTLLFQRPAYRACVATGLVLDTEGRKMSKSRGNVLDPSHLLEKFGGDAVRWTFYATDFTEPMKMGERSFEQGGARSLGTLVHVATFYRENATADGLAPSTELPHPKAILDRWLLGRLDETIRSVTGEIEEYEFTRPVRAIAGFVDDVSQWYLRRSRPRFWGETGEESRRDANDTLSFTLLTLARLTAPFAPFLAEWLHQEVGGGRFAPGATSVHALDWPGPIGTSDPKLAAAMAELRALVETGRELRQRAQVKSRVPLPTLVIVGDPAATAALGPEGEELLQAELNVRDVRRESEAPSLDPAEWVWRERDGRLQVALSRRPTPELQREGWVREALRRLQSVRKEMRLAYTDPVRVTIHAQGPLKDALDAARERIQRELIALEVEITDTRADEGPTVHAWDVDGEPLAARVERAATAL
ncbi:MAG TPA: isoleucine--tRNA ligase [Thermoplasmata archaeon]|nr:isoleucine--tRNA ligase [Thermoplasmata archaeon]